jgi:hypothetical protein
MMLVFHFSKVMVICCCDGCSCRQDAAVRPIICGYERFVAHEMWRE